MPAPRFPKYFSTGYAPKDQFESDMHRAICHSLLADKTMTPIIMEVIHSFAGLNKFQFSVSMDGTYAGWVSINPSLNNHKPNYIHIGYDIPEMKFEELQAIVYHEMGHVENLPTLYYQIDNFAEKFGLTFLLRWNNHRAEYAADAYAKSKGYDMWLIKGLRKLVYVDALDSISHPSPRKRINKLLEI